MWTPLTTYCSSALEQPFPGFGGGEFEVFSREDAFTFVHSGTKCTIVTYEFNDVLSTYV